MHAPKWQADRTIWASGAARACLRRSSVRRTLPSTTRGCVMVCAAPGSCAFTSPRREACPRCFFSAYGVSAESQPASVPLDSCTRPHIHTEAHLEAEVVLRLVPVRLVQVILIGVQIRLACIL
jgi:hypothetical protein